MICRYCGSQISDRSMVCPICGRQVAGAYGNQGYAGSRNQMYRGDQKNNNVFSPLGNNPGTDDILEFVLWVVMCVAALLALLAGILTKDISSVFFAIDIDISAGFFRGLWLFIALTEAGTAVPMALRKRSAAMLCHCFGMVLMLEPFYIGFSSWLGGSAGLAFFNFLVILTAIGYCICACLQYLSRLELKLAVSILNIVLSAMAFLAFVVIISKAGSIRNIAYGNVKYGFGSAAYLLGMIVLSVYGFCYHKGIIDNSCIKMRKALRNTWNGQRQGSAVVQPGPAAAAAGQMGMSSTAMGQHGMQPSGMGQIGMQPSGARQIGMQSSGAGQPGMQAAAQGQISVASPAMVPPGMPTDMPGIMWLEGVYTGRMFPMNGEIIIGSAQQRVHLEVMDAFVSKQHCSIRFNQMMGCYEICDLSTNGTYVNNQKIPKGNYVPCARGSVVALGSTRQQFRVL